MFMSFAAAAETRRPTKRPGTKTNGSNGLHVGLGDALTAVASVLLVQVLLKLQL